MAVERDTSSVTNGLPYIITGAEAYGDRQMRFHYLLPSGRRRSVVVNSTDVSEDDHLAIVRGIEADDYRMRPGRPRRLSDTQGV
jgi:hypothetical protein